MKETLPTLSLRERDRRWKLIRDLMSNKGLACLIVAGLSGREEFDGYLSNESANGIVVFPLEGEPTYLCWAGTRVLRSKENAQRVENSWIEDVRVGASGPGVVAVLKERGFETQTVGVVGIEIGSPQQPEGYVPFKTWSYVLSHLPKASFIDVSRDFCDLIMVKSDEELALVRRSARIGERACEALLATTKLGVGEGEMAAAVVQEIFSSGAGTRMPNIILHTGVENLSWGPPLWTYRAQPPRRVQKGDVVLSEVFVIYGGLETQQQMCLALSPVAQVDLECAEVARRSYEAGLRALCPGKKFREVAEAMEEPLREAGCWHLTPLIHSLNPLTWVGPTNVGIDQVLEIPKFGGMEQPDFPTGEDWIIKPGMVFELEPNACRGKHRINIGGTVIVSEDGVEELNELATQMRIV